MWVLKPLKWLFWLLVAWVLLFVITGGAAPAFGKTLYLIFAGWIKFLIRVLPEVRINWPTAASGTAAALLAGWILHRFGRRFAPDGAWRARQTIAVMSCLLALFASAIFGTGIVHQLGWLVRGPVLKDKGRSPTFETNRIRQLYMGIKLYAADYGGAYPDELEQLVGERIVEEYAELGFAIDADGKQTEPFAYFGAGLKESDPKNLIVVASPRPAFANNSRMVATNDGAVKAVAEDEFQKRLAEQKPYYARTSPSR